MNVSLTPRLESLVQEKVRSGMYGSASEVVREALRLLDERDRQAAVPLDQVRQQVAEGLAQLDHGKATAHQVADLRRLGAQVKAAGRKRTSRR